jgi:hypothetical protein
MILGKTILGRHYYAHGWVKVARNGAQIERY